MKIVREAMFPDHHLYTLKDLSFIKERSKEVDCIVTTEKDMVKLKELNLDPLPLRALRIDMKIWEEKEFYQRIITIF
jgi:tetraacyldisaccharide-1-P 4'-kinase